MWIEAITVRTARSIQCQSILEELNSFKQRIPLPKAKWVACYQNLEVENEVSIHLAWEEEAQTPGKSACGLLLAKNLSKQGLVHHTLWQVRECFYP